MDKSMVYFAGFMGLGFFGAQLSQNFIAPPLGSQLGGGFFLAMIFVGFAGVEAWYRLRTTNVLYIQMLIRPQNEKVDLFLDMPPKEEHSLGDNWYSDMLELHWPVKLQAYEDFPVTRIRLTHRLRSSVRIKFLPGKASKDDYDFPHGFTEYIEVTQSPRKQTTILRADIIPEFVLLSARNDYALAQQMRQANPTVVTSGSSKYVIDTTESRDVGELQHLYAQEKATNASLHQEVLSLREQNSQQQDELRGFQDANAGIKEHAIELVLTLLMQFGELLKVAKHLQGSRFHGITRWLVMAGIAVLTLFFLWTNPRIFEGIGAWASNPQNQVALIVIVIAVTIILFYLVRRKSA